jgi:hypothetical protein
MSPLARIAASLTALLLIPVLARAEITSLAGSAQVVIQELRNGQPGELTQVLETFPGTADTLPIQVFARQSSADPNSPAAAAAAAQFADPRDSAQPNPEEFAVNMTANSFSPTVSYDCQATLTEERGVRILSAEVNRANGQPVGLTGRLFLDGALAIYSREEARDLSGANVRVTVTIDQIREGQQPLRVFSGSIELTGQPGGDVDASADGAFPVATLILTDLSPVVDEFGTLRVLVIPNITIDYDYDAIVGEEFTLRAVVTTTMVHPPGGVGVAAVLGTPTETLTEVIGLTQGQQAAARFVQGVQSEREDPTGVLAFPTQRTPLSPLLALCGLFGLEFVLGVAVLGTLRGPLAGKWPRLRREYLRATRQAADSGSSCT